MCVCQCVMVCLCVWGVAAGDQNLVLTQIPIMPMKFFFFNPFSQDLQRNLGASP